MSEEGALDLDGIVTAEVDFQDHSVLLVKFHSHESSKRQGYKDTQLSVFLTFKSFS